MAAVVVLAAGRGVRMKSALPKVLHSVAGRPMLDRVLATAAEVSDGGPTILVTGAGRERVEPHVRARFPAVSIVVQDPPRGTGDAVRIAAAHVGDVDEVLVLSGDVPLLLPSTVRRLREARGGAAVAFLTTRLPAPAAYGRVVRDPAGAVARIVEAKDATPEELSGNEINAGVYSFERAFLVGALPRLTNENRSGEYYLTDLLGMAVEAGRGAVGVLVDDASEVLGANSRRELAEIEAVLRGRAATAAMDGGATLVSPATTFLDDTVVLEPDTVVEPFVSLFGATRVGSGTVIGQGCVVRDSVFGKNVIVRPYCVIENASAGDGAVIGPFARLREGTELAEDVHVGNFVETKKARLAKGAKANHLTYLGDVTVGERTNVGAGVITCNYDGFAKHQTTIGAGVFVGSDVQLVAPVTVGDGVIIGAGTTLTKNVPADALATSRSPQRILEGAGRAYRERKGKKGT